MLFGSGQHKRNGARSLWENKGEGGGERSQDSGSFPGAGAGTPELLRQELLRGPRVP